MITKQDLGAGGDVIEADLPSRRTSEKPKRGRPFGLRLDDSAQVPTEQGIIDGAGGYCELPNGYPSPAPRFICSRDCTSQPASASWVSIVIRARSLGMENVPAARSRVPT
jgi:hypothetical protein